MHRFLIRIDQLPERLTCILDISGHAGNLGRRLAMRCIEQACLHGHVMALSEACRILSLKHFRKSHFRRYSLVRCKTCRRICCPSEARLHNCRPATKRGREGGPGVDGIRLAPHQHGGTRSRSSSPTTWSTMCAASCGRACECSWDGPRTAINLRPCARAHSGDDG